jgi:hypothetical protein
MADLTDPQRAAADSIEAVMRQRFPYRLDTIILRIACEEAAKRITQDALTIAGGREPFEVFVTHNEDGSSEVQLYRHGSLFESAHVGTYGQCAGLGSTLTSPSVDDRTASDA